MPEPNEELRLVRSILKEALAHIEGLCDAAEKALGPEPESPTTQTRMIRDSALTHIAQARGFISTYK